MGELIDADSWIDDTGFDDALHLGAKEVQRHLADALRRWPL